MEHVTMEFPAPTGSQFKPTNSPTAAPLAGNDEPIRPLRTCSVRFPIANSRKDIGRASRNPAILKEKCGNEAPPFAARDFCCASLEKDQQLWITRLLKKANNENEANRHR